MTVEDNFAFEFVPVLHDLVMLHHNDYQINVSEELVEVVVLVLDNVFFDESAIDLRIMGHQDLGTVLKSIFNP